MDRIAQNGTHLGTIGLHSLDDRYKVVEQFIPKVHEETRSSVVEANFGTIHEASEPQSARKVSSRANGVRSDAHGNLY